MNFNDSEFMKRIVSAAFPGCRSHKIKARQCLSGSMSTLSYWDGGSRDDFVIVNLDTMTGKAIPGINPLNPPANWRDPTVIQPGTVIVKHSVFCGKDSGYTIHFLGEKKDTA